MDVLEIWNAAVGAGLEGKDLSAGQMAARAVLIYIVTLAFVRVAKKRFLGQASAFDVVVGIIVGSIASRAITGNAPLLGAIGAVAVIIAMHWLFSGTAMHWHGFGVLIKGRSKVLIKDGQVRTRTLRSVRMTDHDLEEALREQGLTDAGQVAEARLERNGSVSVIKAG